MEINIRLILKNLKYLLFAFIATALLYSLLPVSYSLFHNKIYNMIQKRKLDPVKLETIKIEEKEKEVKKIKKHVKSKISKPQSKSLSRFNLDLSVLAGGDGSGIIADSDFSNVLDEGEVDVPPILKRYVPPRYPLKAKEEGVSGTVKVRMIINESGSVVSMKVLREPRFSGFGNALIEASRKWKYEPAKLNGLPVSIRVIQEFTFELNEN